MWIRAHDGTLVNLTQAHSLHVEQTPDGHYAVYAWMAYGDTILSEPAEKDDAIACLQAIWDAISAAQSLVPVWTVRDA